MLLCSYIEIALINDNNIRYFEPRAVREMSVYANRGKSFEILIEHMNSFYRDKGIATIHKVPTEWIPIRKGARIVGAKVTRKAAVDFIGVANGIAIAFDAKDCAQDAWSTSNLHVHQRQFLADFMNAGGLAFVLLRLKENICIVPLSVIEKKKTIKLEDCIVCGINYLKTLLEEYPRG